MVRAEQLLVREHEQGAAPCAVLAAPSGFVWRLWSLVRSPGSSRAPRPTWGWLFTPESDTGAAK